jgi:hypothetical protein
MARAASPMISTIRAAPPRPGCGRPDPAGHPQPQRRPVCRAAPPSRRSGAPDPAATYPVRTRLADRHRWRRSHRREPPSRHPNRAGTPPRCHSQNGVTATPKVVQRGSHHPHCSPSTALPGNDVLDGIAPAQRRLCAGLPGRLSCQSDHRLRRRAGPDRPKSVTSRARGSCGELGKPGHQPHRARSSNRRIEAIPVAAVVAYAQHGEPQIPVRPLDADVGAPHLGFVYRCPPGRRHLGAPSLRFTRSMSKAAGSNSEACSRPIHITMASCSSSPASARISRRRS